MIDNPVPDAGGGCRIQVTIKFKVRLSVELAISKTKEFVCPELYIKVNYLILKEQYFSLTG
jgi:hypothetical protein